MATPHRPSRAFGYHRVSTDAQAESGLGLDAQRDAVKKAAARLGLPVAALFTDAGVSGALDLENGPQLFAAVQQLRRGDVLIVAKRDRIGRDLIGVAMIERAIMRKGARIVSAAGEGTDGTDASAMMQRQTLDVFAEYERHLIGQRTRAALQAKRARGERAGSLLEQHEERQASDTDQDEGKDHSGKSSTLVPHGQKEPAGTDAVIDAEVVDVIEDVLVSQDFASWNQVIDWFRHVNALRSAA